MKNEILKYLLFIISVAKSVILFFIGYCLGIIAISTNILLVNSADIAKIEIYTLVSIIIFIALQAIKDFISLPSYPTPSTNPTNHLIV